MQTVGRMLSNAQMVLPSGTVTLLFSDVEGSTALLTRLGASYADLLDTHRTLLREAWQAHGGVELGTEGDSFYVVFSSALSGVLAAVDAQRSLASHDWPGGVDVRVRIGVHTGEPQRHGDAYVGIDVHRAARVAGSAHGGQIVVTDATGQLVRANLPPDVSCLDLGWHRFRDLQAPEHLHQVTATGLAADFPPVRSIGAVGRLPLDPMPLIGRDADLGRVKELLAAPGPSVVTLIGPGGSGKTRLAVAAASELAESFKDGAFFVSLAAIRHAADVWTAVADALDVPVQRTGPAAIREYLRDRQLLLILDNLEQIPNAGRLAHELMADAPGLALLATSRRPLQVRHERTHPVGPLALPAAPGQAAAGRSSAVEMFVQHARLVRPDFSLDAENADDVAELCRRLDGLPLALELAAARMRLMSPRALLERWTSSGVFGDSTASRPDRHRTLDATLRWSYDLLAPEHQRLLRALGAFASDASLDAIEAVATGGRDPVDDLTELADAAFVVPSEADDRRPRVQLLETIRDFAVEELRATGELDAARRRHAAYFAEVVDTLAAMLHTARDDEARRLIAVDYPNIRAALEWCLRPDDEEPPPRDLVGLGQQMAAALRELWNLPHPEPDPGRWLRRAADLWDGTDSPTAAAVFARLGRGESEEMARRALEMSRRLGDKRGVAEALHMLELFYSDDAAAAMAILDECIALAREVGDDVRLSWVLGRKADVHSRNGEPTEALRLVDEVIALTQARGDQRTALEAELDKITPLIALGRAQEARALLDAVTPMTRQLAEDSLTMTVLGRYLAVFAELGDDERAAQLEGARWGAYDALYGHLDVRWNEAWQARGAAGTVRARLGEAAWEAAIAAGRARSLSSALDLALEPGVRSAGGGGGAGRQRPA